MTDNKFYKFIFIKFIILLLIFSSADLKAQSVTKARIKKPHKSIVGRWAVAVIIENGKRRTFESDDVYDFFPDGLYQRIYFNEFKKDYRKEDKPEKGRKASVIERGNWELADSGRTLILYRNPSSYGTGKSSLIEKQVFTQPNNDAFAIKKLVDSVTVSFIYIRKPFPSEVLNSEIKTE